MISKSDVRAGTDQPSARYDDPGEQIRSTRIFYRAWRPTRPGKFVNRCWARLSGMGLTPRILLTLEVRGRTSGRLRSNVLVPVMYGGQQYLVSMLGDRSEWVRNVRAACGEAYVKRGKRRPVKLTEVPPAERAPILKAYCQVATEGRHHFPVSPTAPVAEFEPIAERYPVFCVERRT
jgi:hypothetical protein